MKKKTMSILAMLALTTLSIAKTYTIEGTYLGSRCGDLCYMNFETEWGKVSLYGYVEDYKNIQKGKKYKVDYEKNIKIQMAEMGELEVKGITKITAINQSSSGSSKTGGKYFSYIKKECKSFGVPYCYLEKRYELFQKECAKGDRVSCKNIKDIDKAIKSEDLEGINYLSNSRKTGKGR